MKILRIFITYLWRYFYYISFLSNPQWWGRWDSLNWFSKAGLLWCLFALHSIHGITWIILASFCSLSHWHLSGTPEHHSILWNYPPTITWQHCLLNSALPVDTYLYAQISPTKPWAWGQYLLPDRRTYQYQHSPLILCYYRAMWSCQLKHS